MSNELKNKPASAEKMLRMYEGLFKANAAVTSTLNRDEVLNLVMAKARELLNAEAASIFIIDEETDELVLEVSINLPPDSTRQIRFPRGLGVAGWVAANGLPVMTDDITQDSRFYSGVQEKTGFHTHSYLCVPLQIKGRIIGTAQVLNRKGGGVFSEEDLFIMEGFARQATIALENARLHEEELEKRRLEEELELAHQIQMQLLPKRDPEVPGYDISGVSYPSRWVGGDYFDFIHLLDGRISVTVADVCGKGIPAAVLMSSMQAVLHSLTDLNMELQETINNLNRYVYRNTAEDRFITSFYSELDYRNHKLSYINCGHNPPFLFRRAGEVEKLSSGGLVLGVLEDAQYTAGEVKLEVGDLALMYTDGVTEVHNAENEMFSEHRLIQLVSGLKDLSARAIIEKVNEAIQQFGRQHAEAEDDITIVCLKRLG